MKLRIKSLGGTIMSESKCFTNDEGWVEAVNHSATFDIEYEIALGNFNEGSETSGEITDADGNVECYFEFI